MSSSMLIHGTRSVADFSVREIVDAVKRNGYESKRAAKDLGVSRWQISQKLRRNGLRMRPKFCLHTPEEMRRIGMRYRTATAAAKDLGVYCDVLVKGFKMHGVEWPWAHDNRRRLQRLGVDAVRDICASSLGIRNAAKRMGVNEGRLRAYARRHDISFGRYRKISCTEEELRDLYWRQGLGSPAIARKLGCSSSGVYWRMRRLGIPTRGHGCKGGAMSFAPVHEASEKSDSAFATEPQFGA